MRTRCCVRNTIVQPAAACSLASVVVFTLSLPTAANSSRFLEIFTPRTPRSTHEPPQPPQHPHAQGYAIPEVLQPCEMRVRVMNHVVSSMNDYLVGSPMPGGGVVMYQVVQFSGCKNTNSLNGEAFHAPRSTDDFGGRGPEMHRDSLPVICRVFI